MGKVRDRTGEILGKYKFLYQEGLNDRNEMTYAVQCMKCGFIRHGQTYSKLKRRANTKCFHIDDYKKQNNANWYSSRLRNIYVDMKRRCNSPKSASYYRYGGRGIKVCELWETNPQAFNDWAIDNGYTDNLTIDRIDNYRGYSPDNCRWVTKEFNSAHQRTTHYVTVNGITHTFPEWCEIIGLEESRLNHTYHRKGMPAAIKIIKDYLDHGIKPKSFKHVPLTVNGITKKAFEWADYLGLQNRSYIKEYYRINGKTATLKRIKEILDNPDSYKYQPHKQRTISVDGVSKPLTTWCDELGLDRNKMTNLYKNNKSRAISTIAEANHNSTKNKPLVIKLGGLKIGLG